MQSCLRGGARGTSDAQRDKVAVLRRKKKGKENIFTLTTTWMIRRIGARWFPPLRQRRAHRTENPVSCLLQCSGSSAAVRGRHSEAEGRWEAWACWGEEEEAREEAREGDSIYADGLRRLSAVMMRDETAEVLNKEEWNESKVRGSDIRDCCWMRRKPEMRGANQPNSDEDFSLSVDQYLISLI